MGAIYVSGNEELLRIIDSVADYKNIKKHEIKAVLEAAIQSVAKKKYGVPSVRAKIDVQTGEVTIFNKIMVVDKDHYSMIPEEENEVEEKGEKFKEAEDGSRELIEEDKEEFDPEAEEKGCGDG